MNEGDKMEINNTAREIPDSCNIKNFTLTARFIFGCLLITVGTAGGIFFDFSWFNLIGFVFSIVYIAALWLLVIDGFSPDESCAKSLRALSMFKLSAVLSMIMMCIAFVLTGIALLFSMSGFAFLFIFAVGGGIGYLLVKFYYFALFSILDGIRSRIETRCYSPLDGLWSFLMISYVLIAVSVVAALHQMAGTYSTQNVGLETSITVDMYGNTIETMYIIQDPVMQEGAFSWAVVFAVVNSVGMIFCLRTLKKFGE